MDVARGTEKRMDEPGRIFIDDQNNSQNMTEEETKQFFGEPCIERRLTECHSY